MEDNKMQNSQGEMLVNDVRADQSLTDIDKQNLLVNFSQFDKDEMELTKRKRDLLDKFENMYQKLGGSASIENPFENINPDEDVSELWKKLGNNKMLGVLHAFVLLRPVIKDAIEREEQNILKAEDEKANNEAKLLSDMAMKVDYLNSVVHSVVSRVNQK